MKGKINSNTTKYIITVIIIIELVIIAVELVDARYCQLEGKACILHFDPCCREFYCDGFFTGKCVKREHPTCKKQGEDCSLFKYCCGRRNCMPRWFYGTCEDPETVSSGKD
ncbi:unnamed protein product [Amaranthus hypochondriacus]